MYYLSEKYLCFETTIFAAHVLATPMNFRSAVSQAADANDMFRNNDIFEFSVSNIVARDC